MKTQAISKGLAEIIYKPEQAVTVIIQKAPKITTSSPILFHCISSYSVPLNL